MAKVQPGESQPESRTDDLALEPHPNKYQGVIEVKGSSMAEVAYGDALVRQSKRHNSIFVRSRTHFTFIGLIAGIDSRIYLGGHREAVQACAPQEN